jgi:hypothetical protein
MKRCPSCKKMVAESAIICTTFACTHVFLNTLVRTEVAPIHATYPKGTVLPTDL